MLGVFFDSKTRHRIANNRLFLLYLRFKKKIIQFHYPSFSEIVKSWRVAESVNRDYAFKYIDTNIISIILQLIYLFFAACEQILNETGSIVLKSYIDKNNLKCWKITVPSSKYLILNITSFFITGTVSKFFSAVILYIKYFNFTLTIFQE